MEQLGDAVWEGLVKAAKRAQVPVVYCNVTGGQPVPVVEGWCSGCGEKLPWVVKPAEAEK